MPTTATTAPLSIVLVEDSLTIRRQLLQRIDTVPGLRVVGEAADEATALTLIGHLAPDAVLLDLSLAQGGSGIAVLKALRRQGYAGQVHVLSHQTEAYRAAVIAAGANGFFDKAEELDVMLRELTGQPELRPPVALDAGVLRERLDQTVKLAMRDGSEVVVHVIAGSRAALAPLASQLIVALDGADLVGWSDAPGGPGDPRDAGLCVVQIDSDEAPTLGERLETLAPTLPTGQARLPDDALSAGGLLAVATLRAIGKLPA